MAVVGTKTWRSIAYGNGIYVVVGLDGYTAYSTDEKIGQEKLLEQSLGMLLRSVMANSLP